MTEINVNMLTTNINYLMSRMFSINHIDFTLTSNQINNSRTLQIIAEHSTKKRIDVKLPKQLQNIKKTDLENILHILGLCWTDCDTTSFIEQNFSSAVLCRVLEQSDVYTELLKYFSCSHDLDRIILRYVESQIKEPLIDLGFLVALSESKYIDKLRNRIDPDLIPRLLKCVDMNMLDLKTFVKILGMIKSEDRYRFIDISCLSLERPDDYRVFDPQIALKKIENFSFGVLDDEFMNQIDHRHVFFAGGSLVSCFEDKYHEWSDIDLWVSGDTASDILAHTFNLLGVLRKAYLRHGFDKLIWSCSNNVITCYCVGYLRNIQIIMVEGDASKNVGDFDFDCVKVYMKNRRIYGSIVFIKSVIENKICDVLVDKLKDYRVVKALIKGYKFSDELMQNPIIHRMVSGYKHHKQEHSGYLIHSNDEILTDNDSKRQLSDIICKTRNKFYYPSLSDYDEFANKSMPYHESRVYYMVNMMCGHKQVTTDLNYIEKYLDNIAKTDKGLKFTTQYTEKEKEVYNKLKNIDGIDLDNMYLQTTININRESPRILIPIMYQVDEMATKFDFVTNELVLDSEPFHRFNPHFCNDVNDPKIFGIKLRRMDNKPNHSEIVKIFELIDMFDTSLKELFNAPFTIRDMNNDKDLSIKGAEYHNLIKKVVMCDGDERHDDDHSYVRFHFLIDRKSKLLTEIYEKGQKVHIAQFSDLRNVIKYNSRVILRARFDHLSISKHPKIIFPKLSLTRIDVL